MTNISKSRYTPINCASYYVLTSSPKKKHRSMPFGQKTRAKIDICLLLSECVVNFFNWHFSKLIWLFECCHLFSILLYPFHSISLCLSLHLSFSFIFVTGLMILIPLSRYGSFGLVLPSLFPFHFVEVINVNICCCYVLGLCRCV